MQPPAAKKPVVDVLAPKRPAAPLPPRPSVPLAVREAPAHETATPHPPASATAPASRNSATQTPQPESQTDAPALQPGPQKVDHRNTPVGAIVAAIFVMIVLSALTVAIYLKG